MECRAPTFEESANGKMIFSLSCKPIYFVDDEHVNARPCLLAVIQCRKESLAVVECKIFRCFTLIAEFRNDLEPLLLAIGQTLRPLRPERRASDLLNVAYAIVNHRIEYFG